MTNKIETAMRIFTEPRHFKLRLFLEGNIIGIFTGLTIALFRYLLELSEDYTPLIYGWLRDDPAWLPVWIFALLVVGWLLYRIVQKDGMTSGSGIPQLKGMLLGRMDMDWARVLVLKFTGAVLGIGAGLSLGREGPSVQLGACIGQGVGRVTKRSFAENHYLLTAGAGAGLAAAFNAPLAGVIFCLEELTKNFSPFVLMGSIAAAVTATTVTQYFFGMEPVFHMGEIPVVATGSIYALLIALGAFVGLLGLAFNRMLTRSLDGYDKARLPHWAKPMVPLLLACVLGFALPQVLGGGSRLVDALVVTDYSLLFLVILLLGKFFFTMVCFGSGVPGGIFLPMLVLGSVGGAIFAKLAVAAGGMEPVWTVNCIIFGMAAYFAAVVKSPVTGAVLIMEMTGSFDHMLALILVSMTAYLVADLTNSEPVYDMLLNRSLALRTRIETAVRRHRIMSELIVGMGSQLDGALVREICWPAGSLLVNVRRGGEELAPNGSLQLREGDYLYVLSDDVHRAALESLALEKSS
ncbi:ClC family H(+)/Cl(-) exchange transporter [Selenomonas caprae]|uniref:ClC family H(+)/Cl(-) exchange transporter n=1 Tax=Selenomonas caprae TaxID=2606905 RepID=A0A5D6WL36_9FIRM|nr:ClC family H(+)/Cl(-) exchange transporter [Selenomonas caprae]TYZ28192.1 ClC family H(+)/Cl(-) exchange transporter [Selenomonas caprae]